MITMQQVIKNRQTCKVNFKLKGKDCFTLRIHEFFKKHPNNLAHAQMLLSKSQIFWKTTLPCLTKGCLKCYLERVQSFWNSYKRKSVYMVDSILVVELPWWGSNPSTTSKLIVHHVIVTIRWVKEHRSSQLLENYSEAAFYVRLRGEFFANLKLRKHRVYISLN